MISAIGGIFIYSENPENLANWYSQTFGLTYEYTDTSKAYYITFPYREQNSEMQRYMAFSILHTENRPFVNGKIFTVNLRVQQLSKILSNLHSQTIAYRGPDKHEEGIFAWLNDPEGNYIELWEDLN